MALYSANQPEHGDHGARENQGDMARSSGPNDTSAKIVPGVWAFEIKTAPERTDHDVDSKDERQKRGQKSAAPLNL